ncbi:Arylsulfatase [Symmachiella dynata]|uniref:sulfatase n=1 Tax=Symmachiella dynata TaxID=2527995 RepID=UPI00118AD625|nr:sulfatase [Symmachiella dynata]QDT46965.1 Arylsulfatase [Symmachiella dynata]
MTYRLMLRCALGISAGVLLLLLGTNSLPAAEKPNVLFIAVDDLNDWTGALGGYPGIETPNLDRLAGRGVLFTRAYCSAPACNPSRASLLTGIRPSTSGVYQNSQPWRRALPDAVTLPQQFQAAGYRVWGGGKIYHGRFPDRPSWHEYFKRPQDPHPKKRPANGIAKTSHFDWGPVQVDDEEMSDAVVTSWGIDFLKQKQPQPFFLAVGLFRPHLPWYAPQKYFDQYPLDSIRLPKVLDDDLDDVPAVGKKFARLRDHRNVTRTNNWKKAVQGYLASITFTDAQVGRLLDALDASGHAENTIIVLWSDHGWHLGEKHHWRKFALWEEATRVTMMITAPGITQPGGRCQRTVSLLDIYPTLCDLCGLDQPEVLEGESLRPLLKNPAADWTRPAVTTHGRNNHAARSERWRYIRYEDGGEELYDHDADPLEWKNLAADEQYADVKAELAKSFPTVNVQGIREGRGKKGKKKNDKK